MFTDTLKQLAHSIINEVHDDLAMAAEESGCEFDSETLADCVGDRMHSNDEFAALPYDERRAALEKICKEYV